MYNTNKFYDRKGRRLAVFCRFLDYNEAEIVIFTCSKADRFNKKFATEQYNKYLNAETLETKPEVVKLQIKAEERELKTMLNYCVDNLYYPYLRFSVKSKNVFLRANSDVFTNPYNKHNLTRKNA